MRIGIVGLAVTFIAVAAGCSIPQQEGEIAGFVAHHGAKESAEYYYGRALTKNPDDVYKFYLFNLMYGSLIKGYPFSDLRVNESLLNCAAQGGSKAALERAVGEISASTTSGALAVKSCLGKREVSATSWGKCRAATALMPCDPRFLM